MSWAFLCRGGEKNLVNPEDIDHCSYYVVDFSEKKIYGYTAAQAALAMSQRLIYNRKANYISLTTNRDHVESLVFCSERTNNMH